MLKKPAKLAKLAKNRNWDSNQWKMIPFVGALLIALMLLASCSKESGIIINTKGTRNGGDSTATITVSGTVTDYDLAVTIAVGSGQQFSGSVTVTLTGARTAAITAEGGDNTITLDATTRSATLNFNNLRPDIYTLDATASATAVTVTVSTAEFTVSAPELIVTPPDPPAKIDLDETASIDLALDKAPIEDVMLTITTDPATVSKAVTFSSTDSGSNLTKPVEFTTNSDGSSGDIDEARNYTLEIAAVPANLIELPVPVTFTVVDSTIPTVTITPTVTDKDLSVDVAVTELTLSENVEIVLSFGGTPADQTVTLASGSSSGTAPMTVPFNDLAPGSYMLTATPAPFVNIEYAGSTQIVTIQPEITIEQSLSGDDLTLTAEVTDGPIGSNPVSVLITLTETSSATTMQTITFPASAAMATSMSTTFFDVESGSYTISAEVTSGMARIIIPTPTGIVLPKATLSLSTGGVGSLTVTATITDGTLGTPVDITPVLSGPSTATVPALSLSATPASHTFVAGDLQPGDWSFNTGMITAPVGIILTIEPATVTVAAPTLVLTISDTIAFSTDTTALVSATARPYTGGGDINVMITASTNVAGSVDVTATATLTASDYTDVETTVFSGLRTSTYILTAAATPIGTVNSSMASNLTVTELEVTLTRMPTDTVTINEDFTVTATVTNPADYGGTTMLELTGIGAPRILTLTGTTPQQVDFGMLAVGDYTLSAAGNGTAAIANISFSVVAIPRPGVPDLSGEVLDGNGIGNADHIKGYTLTVNVSHSGFLDTDMISLLADGTPLTGISPADSQPVSDATGNELTFEVVANSQLAGVNVYAIRARATGTRSGSTEMSDSTTSRSLMVTQDVDEDGDSLIELATAAMVGNISNDLAGTSYDTTTAAGGGSTTGCSGVCAGYELAGDITLAGTWTPIGSDSNLAMAGCQLSGGGNGGFSTTLEGGSNLISGLSLNGSGAQGLFACIDGATIRNLRIALASGASPVNGSANEDHIGILTGAAFGTTAATTIDRVAVYDGDADATSNTGVDIGAGNGSDQIGALVGTIDGNVTISNSVARRINLSGGPGEDSVGGLVGGLTGGSTAAVIRSSQVIDGLVDIDAATSSNNRLGGLIGRVRQAIATLTITLENNLVLGGGVTGGADSDIGGLIGRLNITAGTSTISNSLTTAAIAGGDLNANMGSFIGRQTGGTIVNSHWDTTTDTSMASNLSAANGIDTGVGNGAVTVVTSPAGQVTTRDVNQPIGLPTTRLQLGSVVLNTNAGTLATESGQVATQVRNACLAVNEEFSTTAIAANCSPVSLTVYDGWDSTAIWNIPNGSYPCLRELHETNLGFTTLSCN